MAKKRNFKPKKGIHENETYNHARNTSNAEMFIHHAVFSIQAGTFLVVILVLYLHFIFFENIFLFKYVLKLVFYWICDQITILRQLYNVRYVKKKLN